MGKTCSRAFFSGPVEARSAVVRHSWPIRALELRVHVRGDRCAYTACTKLGVDQRCCIIESPTVEAHIQRLLARLHCGTSQLNWQSPLPKRDFGLPYREALISAENAGSAIEVESKNSICQLALAFANWTRSRRGNALSFERRRRITDGFDYVSIYTDCMIRTCSLKVLHVQPLCMHLCRMHRYAGTLPY